MRKSDISKKLKYYRVVVVNCYEKSSTELIKKKDRTNNKLNKMRKERRVCLFFY